MNFPSLESLMAFAKAISSSQHDMEGFQKQKGDAAKLRFCLKTLEKLPEALPKASEMLKPKNDKVSTEARTKGNEFFKAKDYISALDFYNRSICHAKSKQNLGMGYANRSAVYFHAGFWKFCLENIELALKNDYPEQFHAKLESRRAECLEKMKTREDSQVKFDKDYTPWGLTYPPNEKIPIMIDALELAKNEHLGYFVRATRDLKPGDVLMVEKTFVRHVERSHEYQRCANCLDQNYMNLFPCERCTNVMFCSKSCHEEAERRFHKYECKIKDGMNKFYENPVWPIGIAVRTVLRAFTMYEDPSKLQKLVADFKDEDDVAKVDYANLTEEQHFRAAYFLDPVKDPSELYDHANECAAAWFFLSKHTNLREILKTEEMEDFFLGLLFRFYRICVLNGILFGDKTGLLGDLIGMSQNYATAMNTIGKLLKHSCVPNTDKYNDKGTSIIIAKRTIKAGDTLFSHYGTAVHHGYTKLKERKANVKKLYGFECKCRACEYDYPTAGEMKPRPRYANFLRQCAVDTSLLIKRYDKELAQKMLKKYLKHITEFERGRPSAELFYADGNVTLSILTLMFGAPLKLQLKPI
ncbi:SET and MYND domain-containing protein DDB_G0273589-like [Culicoides brevitarsis]|uniref:SET and MYND domain-containing protein DDB_G0273589-like n=1 Tax=Culicoides brevitarsis TaxID=469753 RepID=UPI00307C76D4